MNKRHFNEYYFLESSCQHIFFSKKNNYLLLVILLTFTDCMTFFFHLEDSKETTAFLRALFNLQSNHKSGSESGSEVDDQVALFLCCPKIIKAASLCLFSNYFGKTIARLLVFCAEWMVFSMEQLPRKATPPARARTIVGCSVHM